MTALSIDDQLLQSVRSSYGYIVLAADLMGQFFNVLVGSFRFFCIHYMDIVVIDGFAGISCHFIGVKYQDQGTFFISLIIA